MFKLPMQPQCDTIRLNFKSDSACHVTPNSQSPRAYLAQCPRESLLFRLLRQQAQDPRDIRRLNSTMQPLVLAGTVVRGQLLRSSCTVHAIVTTKLSSADSLIDTATVFVVKLNRPHERRVNQNSSINHRLQKKVVHVLCPTCWFFDAN
jgi:hypothetical protein